MKLHFFVEGKSEEELFTYEGYFQKFLGSHVSVIVHTHQGKGHLPKDLFAKPDPKDRSLLNQIGAKLKSYKNSHSSNTAFIVLFDADADIKTARIDAMRLVQAFNNNLSLAVCIAVEETEAFYLGNWDAIKAVFPNADIKKFKGYTADSICGTWEKFQETIGDRSIRKVYWARAMAPQLFKNQKLVNKNVSPSFQHLMSEAKNLVGVE